MSRITTPLKSESTFQPLNLRQNGQGMILGRKAIDVTAATKGKKSKTGNFPSIAKVIAIAAIVACGCLIGLSAVAVNLPKYFPAALVTAAKVITITAGIAAVVGLIALIALLTFLYITLSYGEP